MMSLRAGLETGCWSPDALFVTCYPRGSFPAAAAVMLICLSACSDKPLAVSADTYCERARHISATDAQRGAMKADWGLWESLGVQVASHNVEYDGQCLKPKPGP